jgi:hypothetical protein
MILMRDMRAAPALPDRVLRFLPLTSALHDDGGWGRVGLLAFTDGGQVRSKRETVEERQCRTRTTPTRADTAQGGGASRCHRHRLASSCCRCSLASTALPISAFLPPSSAPPVLPPADTRATACCCCLLSVLAHR